MRLPFRRIAIINRGEPAMRLVHAVRELREELSVRLRTIALYTDPDRHALFVREADDAHSLGPALFTDKTGKAKSSYLDYDRLAAALKATNADAVWVGWGFVAEHAEFADLCKRMGVTFIGPSGDAMRRVSDKVAFKRLAEQAEAPVTPWSGGPVATVEEAKRHAGRIGYPLMIKAAAGGGGRGIRRVEGPEALDESLARARAEAAKYFGDDSVLLERVVTGARHVEVQVVGDVAGTVWAVGIRDCTIQRRNQKVLEEAPSPALAPEVADRIRDSAIRVAKLAGYTNAGTVECLYEAASRSFYLMEMNTRLQVEHPVTEATTGIDLVKLQIQIAAGGTLSGTPPPTVGHAIEVRLNAEDPDNQFAPAPGRIDLFRMPNGPGIRVDTGFAEGDVIPSDFDSMIAKIIAYGRNRKEALARLRRALTETDVAVRGGMTNKAFLLSLIKHRDVASSAVDINWLDRTTVADASSSAADVALIAASIESYESAFAIEKSQFFASVVRGQPKLREDIVHPVELRYGGETYKLEVGRIANRQYRVRVDSTALDVTVDRHDRFTSTLSVHGARHHVLTTVEDEAVVVEVDGVSHRISRDEQNVVRAPAPGIVLSVLAKVGDTVAAGDRLVVMEAMKVEMSVVASFAGQVHEVLATANVQVMAGAPLVVLQPSATAAAAPARPRVSFAPKPTRAMSMPVIPDQQSLLRDRCKEILSEIHRAVAGLDVAPKAAAGLMQEYDRLRKDLRLDLDVLASMETDILEMFVDISSVFRPHSDPQNVHLPPSDEYLATYLRTLDPTDLPAPFLDSLRRGLGHFEVKALDRTPEAEEALVWMHKANRRMDDLVPIVRMFLERIARDSGSHGPRLRRLLERMIEARSDRFPELADLALHVSYRCYDEPIFARAKAQQVEAMEWSLEHLSRGGPPESLRDPIEALVSSPELVTGVLADAYTRGEGSTRRAILEVLCRRFSSTHAIDALEVIEREGRLLGLLRYVNRGRDVLTVTTFASGPDALDTLRVAVSVPGPLDLLLLNLLVVVPEEQAAATQRAIEQYLQSHPLVPALKRVGVILVAAGQRKELCHYTYRPAGTHEPGWTEETLYRGIDPAVGEHLELWRLRNFDTERLPSPENSLLFRAKARQNPTDERLFAFLDVREFTELRDDTGALTHLPYLERLVMQTAAAMRDEMLRRPKSRLVWNRMIIFLWPTAQLPPHEIRAVMQKLSPFLTSLGLEKVVIRMRLRESELGKDADGAVHFAFESGGVARVRISPPSPSPIRPLTTYAQKAVLCRRRGMIYPYEIIRMLTPLTEGTQVFFPRGDFTEYDLADDRRLGPIQRPHGENDAHVVIGVIRNYTRKHPEGVTRVVILGDPSLEMGALAEPECRRIVAALDLAASMRVPVEWYPVSSGAKIGMDSGTENLDWTARVLRRLIEFTQAGGEINVVVNGINVGAQSYWNAEATMLMHTRGILVMTQQGSMVLTGKKALDYSGGVSADDNLGIGGVEKIMGVNGQAQYVARDLTEACLILFHHYDLTYVVPGERAPRRSVTSDAIDRDVTVESHPSLGSNGEGLTTIGDVFSSTKNPDRKKPFDIRAIMQAIIDRDAVPFERWPRVRHGEIAVVWDVTLGGIPVCLIGIESRPLTRKGLIPSDGPSYWSGGTLFPMSSKKVARAINAASANRPVVVLANLSGFDGSPESMRNLQLEYGAEIGRAVVNFDGPIVFCVVSRYHGGAYVVFSRTLNEGLESVAVEGSYASVIGGAPAAAVVFPNEVKARTLQDPRLVELQKELKAATPQAKAAVQRKFDTLYRTVYIEKERQVAEEFDGIHSVQRALEVGSLHRIIPPTKLRPFLVHAVERGLERWLAPHPEPHETGARRVAHR